MDSIDSTKVRDGDYGPELWQPQETDAHLDGAGARLPAQYSTRFPVDLSSNSSLLHTPGALPLYAVQPGQADGAGLLPWLEIVAPRRPGQAGWASPAATSNSDSRFAEPLAEPSFDLAALIHDTRNMVAAMELYCDLLEEPGVLLPSYRHYAAELRLVGGTSRRLLERLSRFNGAGEILQPTQFGGESLPLISVDDEAVPSGAPEPPSVARSGRLQIVAEGKPTMSLADELRANQNLLAALAGPTITLGVDLHGGNRPSAISREDLTRVLVNLTKNAAEAMPEGGHIQLSLEETPDALSLTVSDNGPGIPATALEAIFSPGYTTHFSQHSERGADRAPSPELEGKSILRSVSDSGPTQHRGLGLAIVRSIVAVSGGSASAFNRSEGSGALIILEFPLHATAREALTDAAGIGSLSPIPGSEAASPRSRSNFS